LRELVVHQTKYRGLSAALATGYVAEKNANQLCTTCDYITQAGAELLSRAQKAGEIRPDADVREVILTAHSAAWIAEQTRDPAAVDRLLGIMFDGLRVIRQPQRPARKPRVSSRKNT
jgi:hypothetical protein